VNEDGAKANVSPNTSEGDLPEWDLVLAEMQNLSPVAPRKDPPSATAAAAAAAAAESHPVAIFKGHAGGSVHMASSGSAAFEGSASKDVKIVAGDNVSVHASTIGGALAVNASGVSLSAVHVQGPVQVVSIANGKWTAAQLEAIKRLMNA